MRNGPGDEEKRLSVPPASQAFLIRATSLGSAGMRNRPSTSIAVPPQKKTIQSDYSFKRLAAARSIWK